VKCIKNGDLLLVETSQGVTIATATTGILSGDGIQEFAQRNGAYMPLKNVISFANQEVIQYIENRIKNKIFKILYSDSYTSIYNIKLPF
jgi:hypothetical protein